MKRLFCGQFFLYLEFFEILKILSVSNEIDLTSCYSFSSHSFHLILCERAIGIWMVFKSSGSPDLPGEPSHEFLWDRIKIRCSAWLSISNELWAVSIMASFRLISALLSPYGLISFATKISTQIFRWLSFCFSRISNKNVSESLVVCWYREFDACCKQTAVKIFFLFHGSTRPLVIKNFHSLITQWLRKINTLTAVDVEGQMKATDTFELFSEIQRIY